MSRMTTNKSNDDIRNKAISIIRNLTVENDLSYDELGVLSSFLLIERTESNMLKHYEDLEEHGRLIELPCKVGDTVYLISSQYSECSKYQERFNDYNCQGCEDECDSHKEYFIHVNENMSAEWIVRAMRLNRFGEDVFLTKEEAEAKLAEMRGVE